MKKWFLFSGALCLTASVQATSPIRFQPAVLNAAQLFNHDPSVGPVKHSLQWIRNSTGELLAMTDVWYDRSGYFTRINMLDKLNDAEFHIVNQHGVLTSNRGQPVSGKVNQRCQVTELENKSGKYRLSYNAQGLLESIIDRVSGKVSQRFEYRFGQFPVRIRDYEKQTDSRFFYPAGNPQFVDMETSLTAGKDTVWLKQSCSYQKDGNVALCSQITANDADYRDAVSVTFSNHKMENY